MATSNNTAGLSALDAAMSGGIGLGNSGVLAGSTGINDASNAFNLAGVGAAGAQQNQQMNLQNQLQQFLYGTQAPYANVDQLANLALQGNFGSNVTGASNTNSNTNSTTTTTPSAFQVIGGLMGAGGSLLGGTGLGATGAGSSGLLGLLSLLPK
jgi:hypothetical protein